MHLPPICIFAYPLFEIEISIETIEVPTLSHRLSAFLHTQWKSPDPCHLPPPVCQNSEAKPLPASQTIQPRERVIEH
jgi:hypothetical protein